MASVPIEVAFVSGTSGPLGRALLEALGKKEDRYCIGLQRGFNSIATLPTADGLPRLVLLPADVANYEETAADMSRLLDTNHLRATLDDLSNGKFSEAHSPHDTFHIAKITLFHAIGPFKYEGYRSAEEAPGIDPHILQMNYSVLKNMGDCLVNAAERITATTGRPVQVNLCTFGSVSEDYQVPLWYSFNQAKAQARQYIAEKVEAAQKLGNVGVSGLYMRTSSIKTDTKDTLRPHANDEATRYWLTPEDVAAKSSATVNALDRGVFESHDLIVAKPSFDAAAYYGDLDAIDRRWRGAMTQPASKAKAPAQKA